MIRLVIDNGPDPIEEAWERLDALAIEMAAMWAAPEGCSARARMEQAKDLFEAEARFRALFTARAEGGEV